MPRKDSPRNALFNIAEMPLEVKYSGYPRLSPAFKKFIDRSGHPKDPWLLESAGFDREVPVVPAKGATASYFFADPVNINIRARKIIHFCHDGGNGRAPDFNDRLVAYAYSQMLASSGGMLAHAASVVKDGGAYLFFGKSGDGKTTVAELSKQYEVIGDDIVAVKKIDGDFFVFSTPWRQRKFIKACPGARAKIAGIFFLNKSRRVHFGRVSPEDALAKILLNHIHFLIYTARPILDNIFETASEFAAAIPAYSMKFARERDFWPELEEAVNAG